MPYLFQFQVHSRNSCKRPSARNSFSTKTLKKGDLNGIRTTWTSPKSQNCIHCKECGGSLFLLSFWASMQNYSRAFLRGCEAGGRWRLQYCQRRTARFAFLSLYTIQSPVECFIQQKRSLLYLNKETAYSAHQILSWNTPYAQYLQGKVSSPRRAEKWVLYDEDIHRARLTL